MWELIPLIKKSNKSDLQISQIKQGIAWTSVDYEFLCHLLSLSANELTHLPSCRIYASVEQVSIDSNNGLSPILRQAII